MLRLTDVFRKTTCSKIINAFTNKVRDKSHFSRRYESLDEGGFRKKAGSFGIVSKVKSLEDGKIYAIKKVTANPNTGSKEQQKQFLQTCQEFVLLENLNSKHQRTVVKTYSDLSWMELPEKAEMSHIIRAGINVQIQHLKGFINTEFYMVFEWHNQDLKTFMKMGMLSTEKESQKICCDILEGLVVCHNQEYAHNDLKPDNVLIKVDENQLEAKLADFGLSQCLTKHPLPERIGNRHVYDPLDTVFSSKVDIWGFGMMCYELAHAWHAPVSIFDLTVLKHFAQQNNNIGDLRTFMARKLPEAGGVLKQAIIQCLCMRPERRPSANILLKIFSADKSFDKARSVAKKFADMIDPNKDSYEEMLFHNFYEHVFFDIVKPVLTACEMAQLTEYLSYDFPLVKVFDNFSTQRLKQFAKRFFVTS